MATCHINTARKASAYESMAARCRDGVRVGMILVVRLIAGELGQLRFIMEETRYYRICSMICMEQMFKKTKQTR
jgi:hypothetical protein